MRPDSNRNYFWRGELYGRQVQIIKRRVESDPPVGTVCKVMSREDHGICDHNGYTMLTPKFLGVRGYHYLVRVPGEQKPVLLDKSMLGAA